MKRIGSRNRKTATQTLAYVHIDVYTNIIYMYIYIYICAWMDVCMHVCMHARICIYSII